MASPTDFVYYGARVAFASAQIPWTTSVVKCALVTANYSALPVHNFVSAIPPSAILARSASLTGLSISNMGVCSGTIPSFQALLIPNNSIAAMILYIDSGSDASSRLVYYSSTGVGFPFLAQGFDYFVGFDLANGGWFQV